MPKATNKTKAKLKDLPFEYDRDWKSLDVRQNPHVCPSLPSRVRRR